MKQCFVTIFLVCVFSVSLYAQKLFHLVSCNDSLTANNDTLFIEEVVFTFEMYSDSLELFETKFGHNKQIPENVKASALVALSCYPELAETNIQFKPKRIKYTMNARPKSGNIFKKKNNRKYVVLLNNEKGKNKGMTIDSLSFSVLVAWFGHELAHIYTYENMSNAQITSFTAKYLFSTNYKRKVERYTDYINIMRGLGKPTYNGLNYILNDESISPKYRRKKEKFYLSPDEVKCLWETNVFDK